MESDHVLPVSKYPKYKLRLFNLVLCCPACNKKKGAKIYITPKSIVLLGYYYMIKIIKWFASVAIIVFFARVVMVDVSRGQWDTTIIYQVWGEAIDAVEYTYEWIQDSKQPL